MLDATKDLESYQPAGPRWRLSQFRIRVWNPVGGLRWTHTIIVADVLGNDAADVTDAEEDEVIQCLLPKRPDESLDEWGGIGLVVGDGDSLDGHDLVELAVEMTAIPVRSLAMLYGHRPTILTEDAIVIMDEDAGVASQVVAWRICCLTQGSVWLVVTLTWRIRRESISMITKT